MKVFAAKFLILFTLLSIVLVSSQESFAPAKAATPVYKKVLGVTTPTPYSSLPAIEKKTGRKFRAFLWYQSIIADFDVDLAKWLLARGTRLQISWEPRDPSGHYIKQPKYRLRTIIRGDHDKRIRIWARQMKALGRTVYFRPMCEMNGNWTSWSGTVNGNKPSEYKYAWRRIFKLFQKEGATNVKFIWAPNNDTSYTRARKTFKTYYPGNSYVHYIGINGYNWGTMYKTSTYSTKWQKFDAVFGYSYKTFYKLARKPVVIAETGSTEKGGNKAAWTKDMLLRLRYSYSRVKMVYWFNLNKETDWRIQSSSKNLNAFKSYARYHK